MIITRKEDKFSCQNSNRPKLSGTAINSYGSESNFSNNLNQKESITQKMKNLDAQEYRDAISNSIEENVSYLNLQLKRYLDNVFREGCIQLYDKILNSIPYDNIDVKCSLFYKSFGARNVRSTKYVAASLIFFNFHRFGEKIKQKFIAQILNLNLSSFNRVCSTISSHLRRIPEYSFVLELINADRLTEDEYFTSTNIFINRYINYLNNRNPNEINFSNGDFKKISDLIRKIIESIEGDDKFQIFFADLKKKKPKILAAVMCFIFLKYEKDLKLSKSDFLDLLLEKESFKMPRTNFTEVLHQIMLCYFVLELEKYQRKVKYYLTQYINKLESFLSFNSKINVSNSVGNAMDLFDYAIVNGFQILDVNKNNEIDYYFPQNFAFSLLYFTFKTTSGLEDIATPVKLKQCFGSKFTFKHVNDQSSNRLYDYIADNIGRYKGQIYGRETFIEMMRKSLNEFYHLETDFLLRLYKIVDMSPVEFGNELNIHNTPGTSGILRVIKKKTSFTEPQTFLNFKRFITQNLFGNKKKKALNWIDYIQKLRGRDFYHQSVTYPYRWNEHNFKSIDNEKLRVSLHKYFYNIWKDNFPRDIFMSHENPRASMLKFFGTSKEPLKFNEIKNFFKNDLQYHNSEFFLCQYVQNIYEIFKKMKIGKIPDHNPILNNILMNCQSAIGIEIPVWKPIENSHLHYIGHIDLLLHQGSKLIIADYKQNEGEIYRSLPQLVAYGILLNNRLEDYGVHIYNNLLCIAFSKGMAYSFNPKELYPKLLKFVKNTNSNRNSYLLSRKIPKNSKRTDLYDDLQRLK